MFDCPPHIQLQCNRKQSLRNTHGKLAVTGSEASHVAEEHVGERRRRTHTGDGDVLEGR